MEKSLVIDMALLENSQLSLKKFLYLQALVEELQIDLELIDAEWEKLERELEADMYIKIIGNEPFPRQKALDLFNKQTTSVAFKEFWERYHQITGKPKTDKHPTEKHWKRLTKASKQKAFDMISPYFCSLDDPKYCKKARTYLADRNFEDEFVRGTNEDLFINKA